MRRALWAGFKLQLKLEAFGPFAILSALVTPVVYALVIIAARGEILTFNVLLGAGVIGLLSNGTMHAIFMVLDEKYDGTFSTLAATPAALAAPIAGRAIGAVLQGAVVFPVTVVVLVVLTRQVPDNMGVYSALQVLLAFVGVMSITLIITGVMSRYEYSAGMLNGMVPLILVVSGTFASQQRLPDLLVYLGWLSPLTGPLDTPEDGQVDLRLLLLSATLGGAWLAVSAWYLARLPEALRKRPRGYEA